MNHDDRHLKRSVALTGEFGVLGPDGQKLEPAGKKREEVHGPLVGWRLSCESCQVETTELLPPDQDALSEWKLHPEWFCPNCKRISDFIGVCQDGFEVEILFPTTPEREIEYEKTAEVYRGRATIKDRQIADQEARRRRLDAHRTWRERPRAEPTPIVTTKKELDPDLLVAWQLVREATDHDEKRTAWLLLRQAALSASDEDTAHLARLELRKLR